MSSHVQHVYFRHNGTSSNSNYHQKKSKIKENLSDIKWLKALPPIKILNPFY